MTRETLTRAPLVDTHAHVYTTDMPLAPTAWHKPPADATIDRYVSTLDRRGVEYAVLAAASLSDEHNEYSLEETRKHKRLRTTVIVTPTRWVPDANARRMIGGETALELYFT
jgi:predicted TIM-barrel fold metal-dependent hydrolase